MYDPLEGNLTKLIIGFQASSDKKTCSTETENNFSKI